MLPQEKPQLPPLLPPPARALGRVIRPLPPELAPAEAPLGGDIATDPPLSAFWKSRNALAAQGATSAATLATLNTAVGSLQTDLRAWAQRQSLPVTTTASPADAQRSSDLIAAVRALANTAHETALFQRGVEALEALAETLEDCCSSAGCAPRQLSERALSIIARLTTVQTLLADRNDVTLTSVLAKLVEQNRHLISRLQHELEEIAPPDAFKWFMQAVNPAPFDQWLREGRAENDPAVHAELRLRVAQLLAVQCAVARQVQGDADDGPPVEEPTTPAVPAKPPAAAPANKRGGRAGRRAA